MSPNHQTCWGTKHTFEYALGNKYENCQSEASHLAIMSGFLLRIHFCLALEAGIKVPSVAYLGRNIQKGDLSFLLHSVIFLCPEAWKLLFCNSSLVSVIAAISYLYRSLIPKPSFYTGNSKWILYNLLKKNLFLFCNKFAVRTQVSQKPPLNLSQNEKGKDSTHHHWTHRWVQL